MRRAGVPPQNALASDAAKPSQKITQAAHNPGKLFKDITKRTPEEEEDTDVYTWTPPCQYISQNGLRQGASRPKQTGMLIKKAMQYINNKKPRMTIFENAFTMTHKQFKPVLDGVVKALTSIAYTANYSALGSRDYGLPQDRRWVFVVGTRTDAIKHAFNWPHVTKPCPSINAILDAWKPTDRASRLPTVERQKDACKTAYKECFAYGRDPRSTPILLIKLQGFELTDIPWTTQQISKRQAGQLIGNAVSVNTIEAILVEALWSSSLVEKKDENTDEAKERLEWAVGERRSMPATMADVADEGMRSTRMLGNDDYEVWHVSGNSRSMGFERAVPRDIVNRCIQRMRSYMDMFLQTTLDFPNRDLSKVRRMWLVRAPYKCRGPHALTKGVKRTLRVMMGGEAEFIRQRRKAARLADDSIREVWPGSNWRATRQEELDFLKNRCDAKRFIAYSANVLPPQEVAHAVCEGAAARHKEQLPDQLAWARKTERARAAAPGAPAAALLETVKGKPVFVDIYCGSQEVAAALIANRLK
ncbi:unnamed protein product [Prorocentrum cordatum]|uniref:DNA (cytosine-5-)-methyltransferase n=1 Tax=Prorocentrum cordatum TaxID=2364126 RepID=A0ABN9UDJ5_9DINO|nr:unnamed protein product [Polarella glacialis]